MKLNQRTKGFVAFRNSMFAALALLVIGILISPAALLAQNYSGSIQGTVTDPSGAAVAGVTVTVTSPGTGASYEAKTSDLGAFSVPNLPVGKYEVRIKAGSFKEYIAKNVEVCTST